MMFTKLFTITCSHRYFSSGQCNDLQIEPTAECQTLLKNYRMIFKQENVSVYSILHLQPDSRVKIPSLSSALTFYIFITNDEFYNYTKYPTASNDEDNGNTLLFTGVNSNIDSPSFVVSKTTKPSPFLLENRKLFGIISIAPPAVFCNYILTLEANAVKWRYYIIADNSVKNVEVKEKDTNQPVGVPKTIIFKNITNTMQTDTTYEAVKTSFPDAGVFVNESNTEVLSVQRPGNIIQLWNVTDKNNKLLLMDNLPIPSCRDNGQKIVHVLSKNNDL